METEAWSPSCSGSLWKTWRREAAQSEAQGHRPVQELLFVSSDPALRCSGWGCSATRAMGTVPVR